MSDLVINPIVKRHIDAYIAHPPHAVLIYGKQSSGKKTLAAYLALGIKNSRTHSTIMYIHPLEDKKTIGIDQIKQLKVLLRTKSTAYRIIIIPDADILTIEAQNNFLKLLEEPPENVLFILTSSRLHGLLVTVRSRLLKIRYVPPTHAQEQAFVSNMSSADANKYIAIADGRIGLLHALRNNDQSSDILQNIEQAKEILSEPFIDRLAKVDTLSKDATSLATLLDALFLTCNAALTHAVTAGRSYTQWLNRLDAIESANTQIQRNISAKLVLDRLFLVL